MALKFIEGFDDGFMGQHGWALVDQFGTGRFGGRCWLAGQNHHQTLYVPTPLSATIIVGFAVQLNSANVDTIFNIGGANLQRNADGTIALYNGSTLVSTSVSTPLTIGKWRYIEVKYVTATGVTTVRVDGIATVSGAVASTANVSSLSWATTNNANYGWFLLDDVYIADTTGTVNNDFLGDVCVQTLLPASDGTYSQLTTSSGSNHSTLVQESTPNTTDYVYGSTLGLKDSYRFQPLPASTEKVLGVEIVNYAHKDAAGFGGFSNLVRTNGTDYISSSQQLSMSWTPNRDILDVNPNTGTAWTGSAVNSSEFGVQVS